MTHTHHTHTHTHHTHTHTHTHTHKTHLRVLIMEVLHKGLQDLFHSIDTITVLTQYPNHGRTGVTDRQTYIHRNGWADTGCRKPYRASGSSSESRFSQSVEMIPSYWLGYFLKMSWRRRRRRGRRRRRRRRNEVVITPTVTDLDDNNGFLDHVGHFGLDELQKRGYTSLRCRL